MNAIVALVWVGLVGVCALGLAVVYAGAREVVRRARGAQ